MITGAENIKLREINSKDNSSLMKMSWDDFKGLSKNQRKLLNKNARIRMAQAHKEFMVQRASERQVMYPDSYYQQILIDIENTHIRNNTIRIKEGVSQKQHLLNIVKAANYLDHNFLVVIKNICDDFINCAQKQKAKVETATPDSIIYSRQNATQNRNLFELSTEEREEQRLLKRFGAPRDTAADCVSIYGHKYDPFSPTFGDDLYLALDTIIVNLSAAYNYAKEHQLEEDLFNSPWWQACVDGATSNIGSVWLLIEAPEKTRNVSEMIKEVARGTLPISTLPPKDFDSIQEFYDMVILPYKSIFITENECDMKQFVELMKKTNFTIHKEPLFDSNKECTGVLRDAISLTEKKQSDLMHHYPK